MNKKYVLILAFIVSMTFIIIGCSTVGGKQKDINVTGITTNKAEISLKDIIGNKFKVDFGEYVYQIDFYSRTEMTYTRLPEDKYNEKETVQITITELRPGLNMVYWEEASGAKVTHVEDFVLKKIYTNITFPDNTFLNMNGLLTKITE